MKLAGERHAGFVGDVIDPLIATRKKILKNQIVDIFSQFFRKSLRKKETIAASVYTARGHEKAADALASAA